MLASAGLSGLGHHTFGLWWAEAMDQRCGAMFWDRSCSRPTEHAGPHRHETDGCITQWDAPHDAPDEEAALFLDDLMSFVNTVGPSRTGST